ncbi:MAG: SPOR domain-containing protein [Gammaproteobacteria bacterium]
MSTYDTEQLDRLEPAYLANYGLTESPFSNQHDDRFLYLDAERAQRLNLLQHMTQYSDLVLIVQGEEGVGKTSLLTRFLKTRAENWFICRVTANTFMDAGQLLFQVAQGFGVHQLPNDSGQLQEMLYSQIATYHHNDQVPILIVDDAHELPKDALMAIFHLADAQVDDANLLRIILFAEPQIEKILNTRDVRPLRERITHTMSIPTLDEDATAEYLKHRLAVAGFNGGSPFTPKMVRRIFKASGGNPSRINQLAHEILDNGDFEREEVESIVEPVSPRRQIRTGAVVAVVVILAVLVLVFQINHLFEGKSAETTTMTLPVPDRTTEGQSQPHVTPKPETQTPSAKTPQSPPVATSAPSDDVPLTAPATKQKKLKEKIIPLDASKTSTPQKPADTSTAPAAQSKTPQSVENAQTATTTTAAASPGTSNQQTTAEPVASVKPVLEGVDPDPVPASDKLQTVLVNGKGFTESTRVYVRWTDEDHEIPSERVKLISGKQMEVRLTVGRQHDKWQMHVVNPDNVQSNTLDFSVAIPGLKHDTQRSWILSQSPGKFTLQLFGSHELKNARTFIRQHKLGDQAKYFTSQVKGKTWYSVIYGVYPDKSAAHSAINTLPSSLKRIKPWVRRFGDIQASVRATPQSATPTGPKRDTASAPPPDANVFTTALPRHGNVEQNESWIWSQDPSYFTLQLLGARELASVKNLLKQYPSLSSHAVYFHSRHGGRDWYTVIYGVYTDKQKARAAIKRLPPALQKASPWIRSFSSIHTELSQVK